MQAIFDGLGADAVDGEELLEARKRPPRALREVMVLRACRGPTAGNASS